MHEVGDSYNVNSLPGEDILLNLVKSTSVRIGLDIYVTLD